MGRMSDDEVDMAIEIANMCRLLHTLPRAGGLLDQDWYHFRLLNAGLYGLDALDKKRADEEAAKSAAKRH